MKRNILSLLILIAMLLGLVSSAAAAPLSVYSSTPQPEAPAPERQVVKVYFTSHDDLNKLASHYDLLQVDQAQGFAYLYLSNEDINSLQASGFHLEIDAAKTKLLTQPHTALPGQGPDSIPGFPCYRTVEETYTDMQDIATSHPGMAELFDIGDSWARIHGGFHAGFDIFALRLSNENLGDMDQKPTFFLMAEIHAREYVTAETAIRFAELLITRYGIDPDITWLLDYFKIYIVTLTNPDGRKLAEAGQSWRKNVDNDDGCTQPSWWGTDLNRNHTFKWNNGGSDSDPCSQVYMGPSAGSEPEVQAIESFIMTIYPDRRGSGDTDPAPADTAGLFITLHSAAGLVLWPWGWTGLPAPNSTQLQTLGRHLAFFNEYTAQQSYQLYQTSGTSDEFAYGVLGVAGYTIEQGTDFFQDCGSFENTVYPDNRDALLYAFKSTRQPYIDPAGPDSLDVAVSLISAEAGALVELTASANDTRYRGSEPTQNIAAARYSIDAPSWITGTVTYPMSATDGLFNSKIENIHAYIDTAGLSVGRHTIFVESEDVNNKWGVLGSTFLYIVDPGVSPVIEGYVRDGGTNLPLLSTVTAGPFSAASDPATGYYSMTIISSTYDMVANAVNFAPAYANGVQAQDHQTIQQDFLLYPFCSLFADQVENGVQGWIAENPWGITALSYHSPSHSWTDSPSGSYGNNLSLSLTSEPFNLQGYTGISLNFWQKYSTEAGWDYGNVEYSRDGSHWSTLKSYTGSQSSWSSVSLPVPRLDDQSTGYIRFHFTSDSNTTYDGWYIDDIEIQGGGLGCVEPLAPTAAFTSNSPVMLGQPVEFTNQTTGTAPLTYEWDFGDGSATSTETNPSHLYANNGTYTVTLVATNAYGTDAAEQPVTIEAPNFTGVDLTQITPDPIFPGGVVEFSADLLPDNAYKPYSFTVNFGDGTLLSDSSSLDPLMFSHAYSTSGSYLVQIEVQNAGMDTPVTDTLEITILYENFLPITMK